MLTYSKTSGLASLPQRTIPHTDLRSIASLPATARRRSCVRSIAQPRQATEADENQQSRARMRDAARHPPSAHCISKPSTARTRA